jgi:dienelactone hydrolase
MDAVERHARDAASRALASSPGADVAQLVAQLVDELPPSSRSYAAGFCWAAAFTTELLRTSARLAASRACRSTASIPVAV